MIDLVKSNMKILYCQINKLVKKQINKLLRLHSKVKEIKIIL